MKPKPSNTLEPITHPDESGWEAALTAARAGDSTRAEEICARAAEKAEPFPGAHDYFLGRCLAEAGDRLDESEALLRRVLEVDPQNMMTPYVLALALLRAGRWSEAAELFQDKGLPHDDTLLAQVLLTLESQLRLLPERLDPDWPAWPPQLGPDPSVGQLPYDEATPRHLDDFPQITRSQKKDLEKLMARLSEQFMERSPLELIREVSASLRAGLYNAELHLLGGLACEEGGDPTRARAHLAVSLQLEPSLLLSRTYLGRAYWRCGWFDLAEALWRSLPVEGPDDYGRHYHLGLIHEAQGNREDALTAMGVALRDFYVDTRELFAERIFRSWLRLVHAGFDQRPTPGEAGQAEARQNILTGAIEKSKAAMDSAPTAGETPDRSYNRGPAAGYDFPDWALRRSSFKPSPTGRLSWLDTRGHSKTRLPGRTKI